MAAYVGDYIGFTYNGVHSSELGVYRISDGSRYDETLLPEFTNKVIDKNGADGSLFFDSYYTQKSFSLNLAFDHITETLKRKILQTFSKKGVNTLIFDEQPYKYYSVVLAAPPSFKFLVFEEPGEARVYKGECAISLIAYYPYAKSFYKQLNDYNDSLDIYQNKNEWAAATGMKDSLDGYDTFTRMSDTVIRAKLYNCGDVEANCVISLGGMSDGKPYIGTGTINFILNNTTVLSLHKIQRQGSDDEVRINMSNQLIEGYKNGKKTGNIYNQYKVSGNFFTIPSGESILDISNISDNVAIQYDYLYF